eukprot:CAMPEP_0119066068 /NCGR_PEP_ID=MMETSP1178-20130426/8729_1 /TAXON_ID=33656 /ORGANISM="unid sp, Strain CCMP2000" /LENGTH=352 /DNA_ID=CAMNT_0007047643 /DNA_START=31 /DNA_END=1089 /DNA_ORIENTATION=+
MSGWCTIESDPGVFTELVSEMGIKGVQVEELYSLDKDTFARMGLVHGLIFLFKWRANEKDDRPVVQNYSDYLFFATQMIQNACATQAILSILLNSPSVDLGEELDTFKVFTKDFPPELKGIAISNSELVRKAHNSFARPEPFVAEEKQAHEKEDDVFHFISYLPCNGKLYELDGLKEGPILLGDVSGDWLDTVRPMIQQRIEKYSSKEIRFNLMAVVADRQERLRKEQNEIEKEKNMTIGKIQARGGKLPSPDELAHLVRSHPAPPVQGEVAVDERTVEQLYIALAHVSDRAVKVQTELTQEEAKRSQWKVENARRRHNYVPFITEFLKILADRGELLPCVEAAKKRRKGNA